MGILKIVRRTGNRLLRIIEWKGREVIGPLECDAPPILEELETLLRAQAGKTIKAIGDMEV